MPAPYHSDTIPDILRWRAAEQPDARAYVFLVDGELSDERSITYAELDRQARTIARRLLASNKPGDRVLLLYPPGIEFIAAFFGALYAGLVAVPAYPPRNNSQVPRLEAIMDDAAVTEALTTAKTFASVRPYVSRHPRFGALRWITSDALDDEPLIGDQHIEADSIALLQYTSGSTGTPKGVMVTHRNITYNSQYIRDSFSLSASSVSATWLPSFHDMGLIDGVIQPLYSGFLGVILPPVSFVQKPLRWLAAISHYHATHGGGPNFGYDLCVQKITEEQSAGLDLSSWRSAYNGAEPVRAETLRRFATRFAGNGVSLKTLYPCFGLAETTLMVSGGHVTEDPVFCTVNRSALERDQVEIIPGEATSTSSELVSSGRTILQTTVNIVHPETRRVCAPTEVGEVWVQGPTVCAGYWQRPDETRETFQAFTDDGRGPFLRTGDLGFLHGRELFITGRAKDLIIVRGRNVYPQDIESAAETAHDALRPGSGAAFAVDRGEGEVLVLVQELQRQALKSPPVEEIARAIVRTVADQLEVELAEIVLIKTGAIPKTSSGKLQRRKARELMLANELDEVGRWVATQPARVTASLVAESTASDASMGVAGEPLMPAAVALAQWLASRVAVRLKCPVSQIDRAAAFTTFGLDSLALVELSAELADHLGRDVSPTLLYDYPSIDRVSRHLSGGIRVASVTSATLAEPIAIVGMSCRLPGADSPEAFWHALKDGVDAVGAMPVGRWPDGGAAPRRAGWLSGIDGFDPEFFGISPREAAAIDPQHRLLLELTWEALESGGLAPDRLAGTPTGVFIGISTQDYLARQFQVGVTPHTGSGNAFSAAAGRVSYVFGLEGPSLAIDTACSSSLVAMHVGCQSLHRGESTTAIVGGVNLLVAPETSEVFAKAGMMAPDGRCKAFDSRADGYVRSEGGVVMVLKPLSRAEADGDRIFGLVRGSAVNQDGRSNGLTAPNGPSQERVIRAALDDAHLNADDVAYVEAHGTGTSLGDPIEVRALGAVFAERREPLLIGSVKTNVGHLEAAAGLTGVLKAVLALDHGEIPPTLHLQSPNPHIPWAALPVSVPVTRTPWARTPGRPRRAGVSSFGFTGTNAHVILEEAPIRTWVARPTRDGHVLPLSAKHPAALRTLAEAYATRLEGLAAAGDGGFALANVVATAANGRAHLDHRLAVQGANAAALAAALRARAQQAPAMHAGAPPPIAWLFTGQGSQRIGMGARLYETEPVFRRVIDRCDALFQELSPAPDRVSLRGVLFGEEPAGSLDATAFTQPALFAVECALAALWRQWGVMPAAVIGHSVGEFAAAVVAGVFSLDDGMRLVTARGRLIQALPAGGAMLSVFAADSVADAARASEPDVSVAAVNAADEVVLSGPASALERLAATLTAQGISTRPLIVSHAFHSSLMVPAAEAFSASLREVSFAAPRVPVISNVTGRVAGPEIATPAYWQQHLLAPVRFRDGLAALSSLGIQHHLELGPHPVLSSLGAREYSGAQWWPSLRRGVDDAEQMRETVARLYEAGVAIDWTQVTDVGAPRVDLPTYPFQRERCWVDAPVAAHRGGAMHPVLGSRLPEVASMPQTSIWQLDDVTSRPAWSGYAVGRQVLLPVSAYLELFTVAARESLGAPHLMIDRVAIVDAERVIMDASLQLQLTCRRLGHEVAELELHMRRRVDAPWTSLATARATRVAPVVSAPAASQMPDLGVMFFNGADTGEHDTYRLVLETARFADSQGFSSVWVPERHYTAFGGLYPNPAVLMAALARETRRLRLMAGSIVLPLHHPLRAVEDWALVDNLSNGRAGISVAPGWNPDDFAMSPAHYADRRERVFEHIPLLQRLWRGEMTEVTSGTGQPIRVRTYPSPVQSELPLWLTAAGNPASFARAGEIGANLLTHLLDQDAVELAEKVATYREARARAGHDPAAGRVTVMVHTFLGDDVETVRELVRAPYCQYIRENIGLLKGLAYSRGTDFDVTTMAPHDLDEFVDFLYDRFFSTRALLGTPESTLPLVRRLSEAGVNEIACLVDFGPPTSLVVRHLPHLARLRNHIVSASSRMAVRTAPALSVAPVQARCGETFAASQFYRRLQSRGIRLAEPLQGAVRFWRRDDEALAELTPASLDDARTVDVALQAFMAAIPSAAFSSASEGVFVTTVLEGYEIVAPGRPVVWSHATLTRHPKRDGFVGRVAMFDAEGACVAVIARVTVERVVPEGLAAASKDIGVYELQWVAQPLVESARHMAGRWLVCADVGGCADLVAARLTAAGHTVIRALAADVPCDDPAAVAAWLDACGTVTGILHGWAMDAPDTPALSDDVLAAMQARGVGALLHITQKLVARQASTRIWVLTRNAQPAGSLPAPVSVAQSTVWGFGRALAVEHPELWGGAIDLPAVLDEASLDAAAASLLGPDGDDQMALREGRRYVPRLVPSGMPRVSSGVKFDPNAAYLITGGIGGLGRHVARWLLDEGVTDLVLTGLRARGDEAVPTEFVRPGVRVDVVSADASDRAAMAALLSGIAARNKTLKGVVHLAGLPEERPILHSEWTHGRRVMSPKVAGGWVVHDLTRAMPLDFFVTFSSISAVWGSRGQPFYGAANHFLDALTAYRRASGLPAVTVSWGPWADGGMVSTDGLALLDKMGLHAMPPPHAMEQLTRLMAAQASPRVVVDVQWAVFKELFESRGARPILSRVGAGAAGAAAVDTPLARALRALDRAAQRTRIGEEVYRHVADVLGWRAGATPDTRRGFFDLGMDSLMALDLKNRLQDSFGLTLRATVVFNYSTIDALADFLLGQFGGDVSEPTAAGDAVGSESLTDEEALRLLEQQLASIDGADRE